MRSISLESSASGRHRAVSDTRFVVVTPARNEQENIVHTIRSMAAQTCRPALWVIVNDGSNDATASIIDIAAREHSWILAIHRADRGFRKQGGGVVDAFYEGYSRIAPDSWEYLVKFDADLSFEPSYFERCFRKFSEEPDLGIGGGTISHPINGLLVCESPADPAFHVRGATKIYRRQCWTELGGLVPAPGWDTIDELKANMLGWTTRSFPDIQIQHHRFTGTADGKWKNYVKFGLSNYITGYHPLFMAAKCLKRLFQKPYLLGAVGLLWGYCTGYIRRIPQVEDTALIRYIRTQQINKLLSRPSVW
jgi:poly-beta-1,6-N-acetyl-D-glucosamine synthase